MLLVPSVEQQRCKLDRRPKHAACAGGYWWRLGALEASGCEAGVGQLGDQTNGPLVRGACLRVCSHLMAARGIVISSPHRPPAAQNGTIVPFNWSRVGAESLEPPMTPHYRTQAPRGPAWPGGDGRGGRDARGCWGMVEKLIKVVRGLLGSLWSHMHLHLHLQLLTCLHSPALATH